MAAVDASAEADEAAAKCVEELPLVRFLAPSVARTAAPHSLQPKLIATSRG